MTTPRRIEPRWLRLAGGSFLVGLPLLAAVPRWDTLLANNPIYPLTLVAAVVVGVVLLVTASVTREPARPGALRRAFRIAATAGAFGLALVLFWLAPFPASPEALTAIESDDAVTISDTRGTTTYVPADPTAATFVLYPGARVDPRAYAVLARRIAESGSPVTVLKCPFDLSLACASPTPHLPDEEPWAIGGHSLGGVSASSFVDGDVPPGTGLVFWASFPMRDLSGRTDLAVTSIYATQDELTTPRDISLTRPRLPPDTAFLPIDGAVHAHFGDYGNQPGDGQPEISRAEAQEQIIGATVAALTALGSPS